MPLQPHSLPHNAGFRPPDDKSRSTSRTCVLHREFRASARPGPRRHLQTLADTPQQLHMMSQTPQRGLGHRIRGSLDRRGGGWRGGVSHEVPTLPPLLPAQKHLETMLHSSIQLTPGDRLKDARISHAKYLASYNWLEREQGVILVPGRGRSRLTPMTETDETSRSSANLVPSCIRASTQTRRRFILQRPQRSTLSKLSVRTRHTFYLCSPS